MKIVIRLFFKTLRLLLGPVVLMLEYLRRPRGLVRAPAAQAEVDRQCSELALYQFRTCPFCIRVRQEMRRLSLNVERRDAQHDEGHRAELAQGCGKVQVPSLKIISAKGQVQWLSESGAIIAYLRERFAPA